MAGFTLLEMAYWSFYASFLCYVSTYFLELGHSSSSVSTLVAGFMLMGFLGAFFWGEVSDKLHTNRLTFLAEAVISILLCAVIYFFGKYRMVTGVVYPLLGFFVLPIGGNLDSWILASLGKDSGKFGMIRSCGSLAYAPVALLFGMLIRKVGFSATITGASVFMAVSVLTALTLPDSNRKREGKGGGFSLADLRTLFSVRDYTWVVLTVLFTGMAIQPVNSLKIIVLENVHGDVGILGMDAFIGVLIQAPFIAMLGVLRRIPLRFRFLQAIACHLTMLLLTCFARNPYMVVFGSVFTNIGYGLIMPSMRETVETYVPEKYRNIGHNVMDAAYGSLAGVLSLPVAGKLSDQIGVSRMITVCVAVIMVPLTISAVRFVMGSGQGRRHVHSFGH